MLTISRLLFSEMGKHVRSSHRKTEVCGLLAGKSNIALSLYPITNSLASPVRFNMEPQELLAALMEIDENGWDIIAIYHSHPNGPDHPSATDISEVTIPDVVHIIWSFSGDAWTWKPYTIDPPNYHETPVVIYGKHSINLD